MKITQKFFRNNYLLLTISLDIVFVIFFFLAYLINLRYSLTLSSVIDLLYENPAFILLLLHPVLLTILIILTSKNSVTYQKNITSELDYQKKKMIEISNFVEQLRRGKVTFKFSEEIKQDKLVRTLLNMSSDIEKNRKEEELRKIEETQRHWVNEGLAKFGAILRENVDNLEKLASEITSNLTKYLQAQQAGFFVVKEENDEKILDMIALFAYDRKKFPSKQIKWGEGLVGAVAIEQKTIFLKETSNSFVDITSGLGKANPRSLIIVPIKDNEGVVHGVFEMASFKIFEEHEINFIEQVSESIGLTMATIKTGLRTQELLQESRKQAEMMAQQDEIMRHNIEVIEKGRQDADDKAREFELFSNALNQVHIRVNIDLQGSIDYVNEMFLEVFNYEKVESILGQKFVNIVERQDKEWFADSFYKVLETGQKIEKEIAMLTAENKVKYLISGFVPTYTIQNEIKSVMFFALDQTEAISLRTTKLQEIEALSTITPKANFNTNGEFENADNSFYQLLEYTSDDLSNKQIFDLIAKEEKDAFSTKWNAAMQGKKVQVTQKLQKSNGSKIQTKIILAPIKSIDKKISTICVLINNMSELEDMSKNMKNLEDNYKTTKQELADLNKTLNERVHSVKKELQEKYTEKEHKSEIFDGLFQKTTEGSIILENDVVVFYNDAAEKIIGTKKDIIVGKKIRYLFAKDEKLNDDKKYIGNILNDLKSKDYDQQEMYLFNRNKEKINVLVRTVSFDAKQKKHTAIFITKK